MKKIVALFVFGLIAYVTVNAQTPFNFASTPKAGESSKTSTSVNAFTGKVGASIPIYSYKGSASPLAMSISIDYAGGGVNLFQNPSCVGTGWNLNAGGAIYRKINGLPDDLYRYTPGNYNVSGFFYTPNVPDNPCCLNYRLPGYYDNPDNKVGQDSEADSWQFSFLGKQGTIIIPKGSSLDGGSNKIYTIPQTNWEFTLSTTGTPSNVKTTISQIVITDDNGIQYWFDGIETEQQKKARTIDDGPTPYSSNSKEYHYEYDFKDEYYITSWKLTRVRDINSNDEILFEYEDYFVNQLTPVSKTEYNNTTKNKFDNYTDNQNYSRGNQKRIKAVLFKNGDKINFDYSFQNRCDFMSDKALTGIRVENSLGKSILYKPDYVYYSGTTSIPFQSCYSFNENESLSKWLFLKSFNRVEGNDVLKMSEFEYILTSDKTTNVSENKLSTRKLLGYHDYWGFYNGGSNNNSCPLVSPRQDVQGFCQKPNAAFAEIGSLKKIISPNGGYTTFDYEGNDWWLDGTGDNVGGIRVKKVTESDGILASNDIVKEYVYKLIDGHSSGFSLTFPARKYYNEMISSTGSTDAFWVYSTSTNTPPFSIQDAPVGYRRIEEVTSLGKTVTDYTSFIDNLPLSTGHPYPFSERQLIGEWFYGLPKRQTILDVNGNTLKTTENTYNYGYEYLNLPAYKSMKSSYLKEDSRIAFNPSNDPTACANTASAYQFQYEQYFPTIGRSELTQTIDITYLNNGLVFTNTAKYEYDQQKYTLKKATSYTSKGATVEKIMFYPYEYASTSSVYGLVQRNNIASPVSSLSILTKANGDKFITGFDKSDYQQLPDYSVRPLRTYSTKSNEPIQIASTKTTFTPEENYGLATNRLTEDSKYDLFDEDGNLQQTVVKYIPQSAIWDKQLKTVIAKADALFSDIAFTSFETNEKGNWNYNPAERYLIEAPAGKKVLNLTGNNITTVNGLSTTQKYIVSYWSDSGPYNVNSTTPYQSGRLLNGWTYYKHRVTSTTAITISGTGMIDEVRLYPESARMNSVTYEPLLGTTSESSADGEVTKYEYDAFGRLLFIRGSDGNIKKAYCYSSNGLPSPCGDVAPYRNIARTETLYGQCGPGYGSGTYDYTVPANRYMSFISQEDADNQAKNDIKTFGQSKANANVSCIPMTIYARLSYENVITNYSDINADLVVRFYSDPQGTQEIVVSNVTINYEENISCSYGGSTSNPPDGPQPPVICNGKYAILATQRSIHNEGTYAEQDGDHPFSCDTYFGLTSGAGYVIIQ